MMISYFDYVYMDGLSQDFGKFSALAVMSLPQSCTKPVIYMYNHSNALQWRHNDRDGVPNHRRLDFCPIVCSDTDQRKH